MTFLAFPAYLWRDYLVVGFECIRYSYFLEVSLSIARLAFPATITFVTALVFAGQAAHGTLIETYITAPVALLAFSVAVRATVRTLVVSHFSYLPFEANGLRTRDREPYITD